MRKTEDWFCVSAVLIHEPDDRGEAPPPALLDASHPSWRARSLSVYRFWRDIGYAVGALAAGIVADVFGISWAIGSVGVLTFLSGAVVALLMREGEQPIAAKEKG